jgi:predicted lipoprotein with Yx(FWY)xxD motif
MISFTKLLAGPIVVAALVAGCSSGTATPTAAAPGGPVSGSATVMAKSAGGSTVLVDGANSMTLYQFASDTAGSGKSACTGGCATTWPPLTVASGTAPTAGTGASGTLATITRGDGTMQVTYNGFPVYHYSGDSAPGDTNGNYPGWSPVKP